MLREQIANHTPTKGNAVRSTTERYSISDDEAMYRTQMPNSTRRYRPHIQPPQTDTQEPDTRTSINVTRHPATTIPRRASSQPTRSSTPTPSQPAKSKPVRRPAPLPYDDEEEVQVTRKGHIRLEVHPSLWLGLGMLAMLAVWVGATNAFAWWQSYQDTLTYGYPRTYQTDMRVGHHDEQKPSHFMAVNLGGHIMVVEIQGGDGASTKIYLGPIFYGPLADKHPVLLKFKDVNHDGKPDMLILVDNQEVVFINDQGQFRPLKPNEHADF